MNKITIGGETVLVSDKARELIKDFRLIEDNNRDMAKSMSAFPNEAARLNSIAEVISAATLMFAKYYGRKEVGESKGMK